MNNRNRNYCYVCDQDFAARVMKRLIMFNNQKKIQLCIIHRENLNKPPAEINNNSRIFFCINCDNILNREIKDLEHDPNCLRLNVLKKHIEITLA